LYSKGAYLMHMLRWIVGDDSFFEGMKSYFNDPEVANGFANTNQFIKHMETAGDKTFTEFINDWFYGEGFPIYSAEYVNGEDELLKITLSQTTSHPSVNFFEMPVPVRVYNADKSDSTAFRLVNTTNSQEFLVNVNFNVAELKIDPEYWLVSKTSQVVNTRIEPELNGISVFPNPFIETVSVFIPAGQQMVSLQLFSPEGKLIKQYSGNKTNFNWSEIPEGIYILHIKTSSSVFETKIIKK